MSPTRLARNLIAGLVLTAAAAAPSLAAEQVSAAPIGAFVIEQEAMACVQAPCPTHLVAVDIGNGATVPFDALDFSLIDVDPERLAEMQQAVLAGEAIVAGEFFPSGAAVVFLVTDVLAPVVA
jgi:hypothetical protein